MDDLCKLAKGTDNLPQGLLSKIWHSIPIPPAILATLLLGPLLIFLTAQLLLIGAPEDPEKKKKENNANLWTTPFQPVPWAILESFFGVPTKMESKYKKASAVGKSASTKMRYPLIHKGLNACNCFILSKPQESLVSKSVVRNLQRNIPQMISFISTPIDHQPWEQYAQAHFISSSTTEISLVSLLRDMASHALIPAVFGHALLEKHPDILHDMYDMDAGRNYLLKNLPPWTPWPGIVKAHMARFKVWKCLDELQKVLDDAVVGMGGDASWGDLEDVSDFVWKRNTVYREHGFEVKERADITILHSLLTNPTIVPTWQILHILSTPEILPLIRAEIASYATVTKPFSIGTISEAPKLDLDLESLVKKCPLLRSTFLETLRLVDPGWDGVSAGVGEGEIAFPETFDARRFLSRTSSDLSSDNNGTGIGSDKDLLSGSYLFIERTSLAIVAGVLTFWEFEPAEKSTGWKLPGKLGQGGVAVPEGDVRVKVSRRKFEWTD